MADILRVSYNVFKQAAVLTTVYYKKLDIVNADGYFIGTGTSDFIFVSKIIDATEINDFITNLLPDAIETELEDDVIALPVIQVNNNIQRFDLTDKDFIYVGFAPVGTLDSEAGWTINRFQLDSKGNIFNKAITQQNGAVWDDRTTETYQ